MTEQQQVERFETAVAKHQATIDRFPPGPQRDAYVEGLADGVSA